MPQSWPDGRWQILEVRGWSGSQWRRAPLVRETGLILVFAVVISAIVQRLYSRAMMSGLAALPACGWFTYVQTRTPDFDYPNSFVPLGGIVHALLHPASYDGGGLTKQALDVVALLAMLVAFALAARWVAAAPRSPLAWTAALFAVLGVFAQRTDNWIHVYDYGRVYSPLLMVLAMEGIARRDWRFGTPWLMTEPRLLLQLSGPVREAIKGIAG